jgi:hypothetical protein
MPPQLRSVCHLLAARTPDAILRRSNYQLGQCNKQYNKKGTQCNIMHKLCNICVIGTAQPLLSSATTRVRSDNMGYVTQPLQA